MAAKPVKHQGGGNQEQVSFEPMSIVSEHYNFRDLSGDNSCLGEDDEFTWKAIGGLKPGESFTFTPQYAACQYHPAVVSAVLSWQGGELELSSEVPAADFTSWDASQKGKSIVAPVVGNTAQLCMFPYYSDSNTVYSITITNVGSTTATDIVLEGRSENDWPIHYFPRCINGDADNDGWNDSLEHTMASLVYPIGYIGDIFQPYILWGSNYLSADVSTLDSGDEIDSSPADLNDDGMVDALDIAIISNHQGEGNGIPLEAISPNTSDVEYMWNNDYPWRRYDLDGDGYVGPEDLAIVTGLEGEVLPMVKDIIAPTARVISPVEGGVVTRGSYYQIKGHVWDNAAITRVEYLVDGKTLCDVSDPVPAMGYVSPFYRCSWNVPKRSGDHELSIRVTDGAGQITTSPVVWVSAK
ncbi:Ig-like domain-containing protein [Oceanimonas pelagia]|uniref:Ig-like domain-containing protein n=1 Tax=Oceanimonas pelagia TaxID=3028314 RepID=A0AA50Q9Z9_9GAMM|nr:Ig-like domain-containing protein [Oceanimonas pelagia]WMC10523.1 Ig-like domain-containing protein [Oceanimonas pelagia]